MGCGKTFETLMAWTGFDPLTVVPPRSLSDQWERAITHPEEGYFGPGMDVQIVRTRSDEIRRGADVVIAPYTMVTDREVHRQLCRRGGIVVPDEAQALKTPESQRTVAVYGSGDGSDMPSLRTASSQIWPLSGSLAPNHLGELWTHYAALFPYALGPRPLTLEEFADRFCRTRPSQFPNLPPEIVGSKNGAELAELMRPYISRVRLDDVAPDLPPPEITTSPVPIEAAKLKELRAALEPHSDFAARMEGLLARARYDEIFQQMAVNATSQAELRRITAEAKAPGTAERVLEELRAGADHVLVFGWHRQPLLDIANIVARQSNKPARCYIGGMSDAEKEAAVSDWRLHGGILCANMISGGVGLNLQFCRRIIFNECSWSPADIAQAIARCRRIGQKLVVQVLFTTVPDTLDAIVADASARKARELKPWERNLT